MNSESRIMQYKATQKEEQYFETIDFGWWSQYLPLGNQYFGSLPPISDKVCYLNIQIINQIINKVDFLFYDCLDYQSMQITKNLQFYDKTENLQQYQYIIDNFEYESVWYFFSFQFYPATQEFSFLITNIFQVLYQEFGNYIFSDDIDLKIIVGGQLQIEANSQQYDKFNLNQQSLYYFPGSKVLCFLSATIFDPLEGDHSDFICDVDYREKHVKSFDIDIPGQDALKLGLEQKNCDSFQFSSWIKIKKIQSNQDNNIFKLIKISSWNENQQLQNSNLSPFELIYKIQNQKLYVQFITYSYTFPTTVVNFENNPFLLSKEFEIINDYNQWSLLNVDYEQELISCSLQFMTLDNNEYKYETKFVNIKHFKEVQLQVQVGNLNNDQSNFLTVSFYQLTLLNTNFLYVEFRCHINCLTCDGPTQFNCLSCDKNMNREFLVNQNTCICTFGNIDDSSGMCIPFESYLFYVKNVIQEQSTCPFGYFSSFNDECKKCPTSISQSYFYCFECIHNPNDWLFNSICETTFFFDSKSSKVASQINIKRERLIFDSEDLNTCRKCSNKDPIEDRYQNFQETQLYQIYFQYQEKNNCGELCDKCKLKIDGIECLLCYGDIKNKVCQLSYIRDDFYCKTPYYYNSQNICALCKIQNCQYCFEYLSNNLNQCTLYKYFQKFQIDEFHKVGCALCNAGYIFDFTLGECIFQQSKISNCLRSFIDQDGVEVCTLSSIDDFDVAPQIVNCQQYIENCKECILTSFQVIKCIICEPGYVASTFDGSCITCQREFSKLCLQGTRSQGDGWVQLIQSFLMQFLPQQYFYPSPPHKNFAYAYAILCEEGYNSTSDYFCKKYCSKNCLNCQEINYEFVCVECTLDQNFKIMRSTVDGRCLECPLMCAVCSLRDSSQIIQLNSQFILTDDNEKFTYKCLMPVSNQKTILDSTFQIARYLISSFEDEILVYKFVLDESLSDIPYLNYLYESEINHYYLNQIGAKKIQIDFIYDLLSQFPYQTQVAFFFNSTLKQKIFSLVQLTSNFTGNLTESYQFKSLGTNNFDSIYVSQIKFEVEQFILFQFENSHNNLEVHLENLIFYRNTYYSQYFQQQIQIYISSLKNFTLKNITFTNIAFTNSYMLNLSLNYIEGPIIFDSLIFIECEFFSVNLLNFYNSNHSIIFKSIIFEDCIIFDSKIFNLQSVQEIIFENLKVSNSHFVNSTLIEGFVKKISFADSEIINSQVGDSILIIINGDVIVKNEKFLDNTFYNSLLFDLTITNELIGFQTFENICFTFIKFDNSSLFTIQSSQVQMHEVKFNFIKFDYYYFLVEETINFFFKIQCKKISISNLEITYFQNYQLFQMNNISEISIENVYIFKDRQKNNYPFESYCYQMQQDVLGLFQINQFNKIFFQNITILNQDIADSIIIEILSNSQASVLQGSIIFEDINFQGNILQKLMTDNLVSFISLYSNNQYFISFKKINFQDNFYFAKSQDIMISSSSFLLLINCYVCNIQINDFNCEKNMLFNSTNSFIKITANNLKINNYNVKQHNVIKWNHFKKYLLIDQQNELNQDQINSFVNKIFVIKNKACAGQFQANYIQIKNGQFYDLIAQNVPVFDMTTNNDGIVQLYNLSISHIELIYSSIQEYRGTIHINSVESLLNLEMRNTFFSEINQFTNSPIISISPSNYKNKIIIQNVDFINCFSIQSLILSMNLNSVQDQSYLQLNNITFQTDFLNFKEFTNQIGKLRVFETALFESHTLLQVSGCQMFMKNINISGFVLSRILSITDSSKFSMINSNFQSIQQLVPSNLLYFSQLIFSNSILRIENCVFQNISNLNFLPIQQSECLINLNFQYTKACHIEQLTLEFVQEFYFNSILEQINFKKNGAIIFITNAHLKMQIFLFRNQIFYNQCQFCLDGGIFINFVQKSKLIISDLVCYQNIFKQNGCLNLISTVQNGELVKLINSKFHNNQGTKGAGVSSVNMKLYIENSYFINNNANDQGGAVYIENFVQNSKILNSFILNNRAQQGGGIYLNSQQIGINNQSFQKSLLKFNKADKIGNNLIDQPTHFQITINNIEFKSIKIDEITRQLELKPYQILEQGQLKFSNVLMFPSGQQIKLFKIFDPKAIAFYHYIKSIIFSIHNSINEKQNNLSNTTCFLYETLYDQNLLNISEKQLIKQIHFDYEQIGFDLSDYSFNLDPYTNHYLMITINCQKYLEQVNKNSVNQTEINHQFGFQFLIKTLWCQLGEFFVAENCQVCDSQQGYYSVNYNVTKCSIFDKEKFEAITSNQIKLRAGYWRPNIYSDLTEYCLKSPDYCNGGWKGGNLLCTEGHIGALCEECDIYNLVGNGKFQKVQKINCANCNTQSQNIFNYFLTILWSIFSLFISLKSVNKSKNLFRILILNNRFGKIIFKFDQDYQGFILKMLLNYIWIFSIIFGLNLNYQFNFNIFDQTSNSSYYLASNLDCFLSENFNMELIYLRILVTYLYILTLFLSMNFILLIFQKNSNNQIDKSTITNCLLYLYVQNNASIIQNNASLISQRIVSGISFIQGDVTLRFDTETHSAWIKYFIIPNLVLIGFLIPGFLITFLATKKNELDKISLRNHFCYLYNEYSNSCFYWEQVKIWKKIIIIIIISYYENSQMHKVCLIGIFLLIYHHNLATSQPFITKNLNQLDLKSVQFCSVSVFIAGLLYANDQIGNLQLAFILYLIQIFLILITIFPYLRWIFQIFIKRQIMLYLFLVKIFKFLNQKKLHSFFSQQISKHNLREKKLRQNIQYLQRFFRESQYKTIDIKKMK